MIITAKTMHGNRPSGRPNANGRSGHTRVSITTNRHYHAVHYTRKSRRRRNYLHAARDRSLQGQQVGPMFVQSSHLWRSRRLRLLIVSTDVIKSYTSNNYNFFGFKAKSTHSNLRFDQLLGGYSYQESWPRTRKMNRSELLLRVLRRVYDSTTDSGATPIGRMDLSIRIFFVLRT